MNTILKAENLVKTFSNGEQEKTVLNGISLTVEKGDYIAVMGPSGSGKSTLLYNISGLDRMTRGSVDFAGRKLEDLSEKALTNLRLHEMGFVFQQIHLMKNLNLRDNILASAFLARRKPRRELRRDAGELMRRAGIHELAERSVTQASGGQLQRAAICRALINEPGILFGDEPTGALDSGTTGEIISLFSELNRKGVTIFLVTHDPKVAAQAGKVLYMRDGNIIDTFENSGTGISREKSLLDWLTAGGY